MIFLSSYQTRLPFVVYADFECLTTPTGKSKGDRGHSTFNYQDHIPCTVGFKLVSMLPQTAQPYKAHHGADCVEWFLEEMLDLEKKCLAVLFDDKRLVMHSWDTDDYIRATNCHICGQTLEWNRDRTSQDKVATINLLLFMYDILNYMLST